MAVDKEHFTSTLEPALRFFVNTTGGRDKAVETMMGRLISAIRAARLHGITDEEIASALAVSLGVVIEGI